MTEKNLTTFDTTDLDKTVLIGGTGSGKPGRCCVWQDARRRAGLDSQSFSCPDTASPLLHSLTVPINDASAVWRAGLVQFEERLFFSKASAAVEERRARRIIDWSLCEILPLAIDAAVACCDGDSEQTRELSRLAEDLRAKKGAALAALAALAARAARAARAEADRKLWPSIEALLNELLAMTDAPDAAAAQAD